MLLFDESLPPVTYGAIFEAGLFSLTILGALALVAGVSPVLVAYACCEWALLSICGG